MKIKSVPRSIRRAYPNVTKIIDARHSIRIHVKSQDCKGGEPLNSSECALAKAIKREFKADAAIVGLGASYIIKGNKATRFHTPERVCREIVSFDRHSDFDEGSYVLTVKSPSNRLGVKHIAGKPGKNRNHSATRIHVKSARVRILRTDH